MMTPCARAEDAEPMHQEHDYQLVYEQVQFSAVLIVYHFAHFTVISESRLVWAFIWDSWMFGVSHSILTAQPGQTNTTMVKIDSTDGHG
jgi:hypothetical protein